MKSNLVNLILVSVARQLLPVGGALALLGLAGVVRGAQSDVTFYSAGSTQQLTGRLVVPATASAGNLRPAIVVMHGSGGMWSNDLPASGHMARQFNEWAGLLENNDYVALFVDSYTPRGIVEFQGRRPAQDPALDDSACSPAYGRPRDAYGALAFLRTLTNSVDPSRIGLLGFSQGAETVLSAMVSPTIQKAPWQVSCLLTNGTNLTVTAPAPYITPVTDRFVCAVAYYPGCGFYSYFGSPTSTATNNYMPYADVLMIHGTSDQLYTSPANGVNKYYPQKFVAKSQAQANLVTGLNPAVNPLASVTYTNAAHSFDGVSTPSNYVLGSGTADQDAKIQARLLVLDLFNDRLQ